jgi:hypothetical protein
MRAKTVNESYSEEVSYEEVINFAKEAAEKNARKIIGPAVKEVYNKPGEYYVQTGGVSREYRPSDLDELLLAIKTVQDKFNNIIWEIYADDEWKRATIRFDSEEERKTGDAISQYYKEKGSGGYSGD